VLIAGDPGCGKRRLLLAALTSAVALNTTRQARYALVARDLKPYRALQQRPHCFRAVCTDKKEAGLLLGELALLAERRCLDGRGGPVILLAVDDLPRLWANLDERGMQNLYWLLFNGPQVQIWPLALLGSLDIDKVPAEVVAGFRTRLIGKTSDPQQAAYLSRQPETVAGSLAASVQFSVLFDDEWLVFWIPDIGEVPQ
jgi:hypothetical protein